MIGIYASPISGELPVADALVTGPGKSGRVLVHPIHGVGNTANRLIVAGCDPAMPLLARQLWKEGTADLITAGCSSLQALQWLRQRKVHVAGTHLRSESPGSTGSDVIQRYFPRGGVRVVTFATWEEGLLFAGRNPKGISGITDLIRKDVTMINRVVGAGARLLLDRALQKEGISSRKIRGYEQTASGHILAAWHVHTAKTDCCVATRAAARVFGLGFIPLAIERYDLVIPDRHWGLPAVQALLDTLNRSSLKKELEALGGYDTSETGRLVT